MPTISKPSTSTFESRKATISKFLNSIKVKFAAPAFENIPTT